MSTWSLWTFLRTIKWRKKSSKGLTVGLRIPGTWCPGPLNRSRDSLCTSCGTGRRWGRMQMKGLKRKLASIRPDIVQATAAIGWIPLQAALAKPFSRLQALHCQPLPCFRFSAGAQRAFSLEPGTSPLQDDKNLARLAGESVHAEVFMPSRRIVLTLLYASSGFPRARFLFARSALTPNCSTQFPRSRAAIKDCHCAGVWASPILKSYASIPGASARTRNPLLLAKAVAQLVFHWSTVTVGCSSGMGCRQTRSNPARAASCSPLFQFMSSAAFIVPRILAFGPRKSLFP